MSMNKVIKLGEILDNKYNSKLSIQQEVTIKDAIEILSEISRSPIRLGVDKAKEIISYLNHKLQGGAFRSFANASHISDIIANLVYSKVNDSSIYNKISIILDSLEDQGLENGSFKREWINPTIERYKLALSRFKGDGVAAAEWSIRMPEESRKAEQMQRAEEAEKARRLKNYRQNELLNQRY